jgi:hypothetical protein
LTSKPALSETNAPNLVQSSPAKKKGFAMFRAEFWLLYPGRGFVTGHDFSRAEKAPINVLGFSPCRDTPTVELL